MPKKIEHMRIILRMLYEGLFTILMISFLSLFFLKVQLGVTVMGMVLIFYGISYGIRVAFPNNILVFGVHMVLLAGCYYLPYKTGIKVLLGCVIVFLIRDALMFVARGVKVSPLSGVPWPTFLFSFAIYLFSLYHGEPMFLAMAYLIPVLLIVLYYMMTYLEGLSNYYISTRDTKEDTMRKIVSTNTIVIGIIVIVFFAGVCIGNVQLLQGILEKLLQMLIACLRFIILAVVFLLGKIIPLFTFSEEELLFKEGKAVKQPEDNSDDPLLWIAYLALGAVLLWMLYIILKRFVRLLLVKRSSSAEEGNTWKQPAIEVQSIKPFKTKRQHIVIPDKGRRYYRKQILKYRFGKRISDRYTCRDIAKMIEEEHGVDVNQLTEYYAQIRYGREDSDNQPILEAMKRLGKKKVKRH